DGVPTEETEDSQEGAVGLWKDCHATAIPKSLHRQLVILNTLLSSQRSEAAPMEDSNPPLSTTINIKDEPIDEGYDNALLPQSSIRQIKEELENQEVGVGGESYEHASSVYYSKHIISSSLPTFLPSSNQVPTAVPAPPTTTIFIPGRGAVLQAMTPFPLRPPAPITSSLPALVPAPPRPPPPSVSGSVRCSGCSKVLLKGQTAFQRKGSTQLFCSTVCLTGHLPAANKNKSCFQCNRYIFVFPLDISVKDMITIPGDDSTFINFCSQFCLSVFRQKKKQADKIPDKRVERKPEKPPEKPIEHEVTHQGRLHRLCSDACFVTWRKMRHLAMNCCEGCGLYCSSSSGSCQTLTIDRSQLNFCGPTCIGTYKQVCFLSFTIMERDQRGKVQLYCSSPCVERSRPPRHVLTGTAFPCCLCKVSAVPQYHLAMVDGTIRNFCSYDCVYAPKPGPSAGASSVPPIPQDHPSSVPYQGHHHSHTSVPPLVPPCPANSSPSVPGQAQARTPAGQPLKPAEGGPTDTSKLTCHQCSKQFNTKPLLFSLQGQISMFCSRTCCEQYKTQKNILIMCEFCKQEKVLFDTISYNQQDLIFCGESCKQLYKHDLTARNKDHSWRPCTYCAGISQKMLHSHYGGKMEEFCRPHCMSQYTVLYYGMGRCDGCRKQGYMAEKLQCLGSVRNFCNLPCLLQYCYLHFETSRPTSSNGTGTAPQTPFGKLMNPVIADVVSLANGSACQPSVSASTQTDAMRVPTPRRRQMKNKSVLCRPFTMDQESMCQLPTPFDDLTGEGNVKVLMVPVPIPVFIPVPMNMYSQHTPVPMAMPVPVRPIASVVQMNSKPFTCLVASNTTSFNGDVKSEAVPPKIREDEETEKAVQADLPLTVSAESIPESSDPQLHTQPEGTTTTSDPPCTSAEPQPPSSPMMDLETDIPNAVTPSMDIKEDVVQCDSAELSFALAHFIRDVRRPNGEAYRPDSIFYLCLGIQQYLFIKGRIENIFTDELYSQFATKISCLVSPPLGAPVSSRVVESYLWECKQLGAYSPIVLLNTLLFFCAKHFGFTTLAQHQGLSFTNFTRHSKPCYRAGKTHSLRHHRSSTATKRQGEEEGDLEMLEDVSNRLHCPVRLYEFYLSRCPESMKTRTNVFFLQPEQIVNTHRSEPVLQH
uniref:TRASH domain-containing protein n=1 Tax=Cyclopterus lumpus TaxID=8103 RepID=A0A8C2XL09_CYCLU